MNRMPAALGATVLAIVAAACTQNTADSGAKENAVAVVDGYVISRAVYDQYVNTVSNGAEHLTPQQRDGLLDNLIRGQLLAKQAEISGAAKEDKARAKMELQRLDILGQAATEQFLKDKQATEAEMRAAYAERVAAMEKQQYRASHILVKTEDEARKIIAQLNAGGNFAQIAKTNSLDTVSASKGGDLDWFSPTALTPDFANAVVVLKKGETSATPAKTEYGFHVIRVTDIRDTVPPSFEEVKEQMQQAVDGKKVKAWVEGLQKKASIKKSL
jgi:peptidyl-prolyl cis-trans isomerase C